MLSSAWLDNQMGQLCLDDGAQKVVNELYFTWMSVTSELQQESASRSFLFNISVNDGQEVTEHTLTNFADDAKIWVMVNTLKAPNWLKKWAIMKHCEIQQGQIPSPPNPKKVLSLQEKIIPCNNTVWGWRGHEAALWERPWGGGGQQDKYEPMICADSKCSQQHPGLYEQRHSLLIERLSELLDSVCVTCQMIPRPCIHFYSFFFFFSDRKDMDKYEGAQWRPSEAVGAGECDPVRRDQESWISLEKEQLQCS